MNPMLCSLPAVQHELDTIEALMGGIARLVSENTEVEWVPHYPPRRRLVRLKTAPVPS